MSRLLIALCAAAIASACTPQGLADDVTRRAAVSVVQPVAAQDMAAPLAVKATDCVTRHASPAELQALARDVGTVAGTLTEANIRAIAIRPATQNCLAANGIVWSGP